ncbi:plectin [Cyclospora cayetanensis]|uniref:Plectin n=1 Tax=Cyclospora cayetanensis TaxID=88456 RepID=A0A6P6RT50_9EIME|nr:plectin [Cyclospora cayetanensis]
MPTPDRNCPSCKEVLQYRKDKRSSSFLVSLSLLHGVAPSFYPERELSWGPSVPFRCNEVALMEVVPCPWNPRKHTEQQLLEAEANVFTLVQKLNEAIRVSKRLAGEKAQLMMELRAERGRSSASIASDEMLLIAATFKRYQAEADAAKETATAGQRCIEVLESERERLEADLAAAEQQRKALAATEARLRLETKEEKEQRTVAERRLIEVEGRAGALQQAMSLLEAQAAAAAAEHQEEKQQRLQNALSELAATQAQLDSLKERLVDTAAIEVLAQEARARAKELEGLLQQCVVRIAATEEQLQKQQQQHLQQHQQQESLLQSLREEAEALKLRCAAAELQALTEEKERQKEAQDLRNQLHGAKQRAAALEEALSQHGNSATCSSGASPPMGSPNTGRSSPHSRRYSDNLQKARKSADAALARAVVYVHRSKLGSDKESRITVPRKGDFTESLVDPDKLSEGATDPTGREYAAASPPATAAAAILAYAAAKCNSVIVRVAESLQEMFSPPGSLLGAQRKAL